MRNGLGKIQNVVLVGGSSEIGLELVRQLPVSNDAQLVLIGRSSKEVQSLRNVYSRVEFFELDLLSSFDGEKITSSVFKNSDIDVIIFASGIFGSQINLDKDVKIKELLTVNTGSQIRLLCSFAKRMKLQAHGRMLIISSVAAMRPRVSNYTYGASKAAIDFFARGLRNDLRHFGVGVSILRPGFVHTKMTAGLKVAPFALNAVDVGRLGVRGMFSDKELIYAPGILRYVMFVLRLWPSSILKRLE